MPKQLVQVGSSNPGDRAVAIIRELASHRTGVPEVAPVWERLIARFIDLGMICALALVPSGIIALSMAVSIALWAPGYRPSHDLSDATGLAFYAFIALAPILYELVSVRIWGATVGKRILGLTIITNGSGQPPSQLRLAVRTLAWTALVGAIGTFWASIAFGYGVAALLAVGVIFAMLDSRHRTVYDLLAGTLVVRPR